MKRLLLLLMLILLLEPLQAQSLNFLEYNVLRNGKKVYYGYNKYASDSDNNEGLKLEDGTILIPYKYNYLFYKYEDENDEGVIFAEKLYEGSWYPEVYSLDGNIIIPWKVGRSVKRHRDPYDKTLYFSVTDKKEKMCHIVDEKGITIFSLSYNNNNGDYQDIKIANNGLIIVKQDGCWGILSKQGQEILPAEYEKVEYIGNDFIKFKLNGFYGIMTTQGKVIIPTSRGYTSIGKYIKSQKIFPYTMDGYKGECNNLGVQISKIKVSTPQNNARLSSSVTSSSNDSNASSSSRSNGDNTTTVVVKHERDPQPVNVWIPCGGCGLLSPGQCNLCNGTGKNLYGSGWCRSCHGSGRCTYCNGKGGHYEVRYQ